MSAVVSSSRFLGEWSEPLGPRVPHELIKARGDCNVMVKIDSAVSMRDSLHSARDSIRAGESATDEAKPIVAAWVEELAARRQGKRTAAYHAVGVLFDCSESWVRRLLSGEVRGFDADLYRRIVASKPWLRAFQIARAKALLGTGATTPEAGDAS